MAHLAHLEHVEIVGDLHGLGDVLVDQEDRHALSAGLEQLGVDLLGDLRRQPRRWLVDQEQGRVGHQLLGDREHLRFAARQGRRAQAALLAQARESRIGALEHPATRAPCLPEDPGAKLQVLLHGELRKDVRPLRHVADPQPLDRMGRGTLHLPPVKDDAPLSRMQEAEDRLEQRGLPGAVGPDNAGDRPRLNASRRPLRMSIPST